MPHLKKLHFQARPYPETDLYPFNLPLLRETDGIDFPGPLTFFAGDNGTGKSTLLLCIVGVLKSQGSIRVQGVELDSENLSSIRRRIGFPPAGHPFV